MYLNIFFRDALRPVSGPVDRRNPSDRIWGHCSLPSSGERHERDQHPASRLHRDDIWGPRGHLHESTLFRERPRRKG